MLRRHEDALSQRIDAVAWKGVALVNWWELNSWYGQGRLSKATWRDLRDRFREAAGETHELCLYEVGEGVMMIHSDGLKQLMPDGTRQAISLAANRALETASEE